MKAYSLHALAIGLFLCGAAVVRAENGSDRLPPKTQNLVLSAPIATWDEAIPLGNGLMGGLLWGESHTIRLSLDRGDLWDERPAVEKDWWKKRTYGLAQKLAAEKKFDEINQLFDTPYWGATPTKLPAGQIELELDPTETVESFELNLATAEGIAYFSNGKRLGAFFSATEPVALVRIAGSEPKRIELVSPVAAFRRRAEASNTVASGGSVDKLGYPEAVLGREGRASWYVQEAAEGLRYCVCIESRRIGDETLLAVSVTTSNDDPDVLGLARRRCAAALAGGYAKLLEPHTAWWRDFWNRSSVNVPEIDIQRHYRLVQYFYGAASRRGAPPIPLQGVWTEASGGLPPWKGDYHNDLNTQMTYIAYQTAGRFEEGASYLDFLWNLAPTFRAFAGDFYGTPGLACPGVMSLAGQPLGGWGQYSLSPTMSAWSAHLFYLHWRYSGDDDFLRTRAYPWCSEVGQCMKALLKPGRDGILRLPLSSSPEIFNNSGDSWLEPNSNYDLMCLKMLFLALAEMADASGKPEEATAWSETAAGLGDFHVNGDGCLLLDAKKPLHESHRHLSNIIGLYPFNLITREGTAEDQRRIDASLKQWDSLGTSGWCGYSFSWMSCLRSREGDAEAALRNLDIFCKAFILRNGFHVNGDQTKSGFSGSTYRAFTLEGNFLASQAVQEMLLQSWSPTPGRRDTEIIRLFPATPWRWHEASFEDLRAEGGYRVSAKRENNATTWFRITAARDGILRIRDNFGGREPQWSLSGVQRVGENYEIRLNKGQAIEATLAKPEAAPEPPANPAKPVLLGKGN